MEKIFTFAAKRFDSIRDYWETPRTYRVVSVALILVFLFALGIIEANRQGWLPDFLSVKIPTRHYLAINVAFTLVLILEVISMILTLPGSMSRALGKQFEILALIFLRNSFKELSVLPEPIDITGHHDVLWHILAYGGGAIAIFGLLGLYLMVSRKLDRVLSPGAGLDLFIKAKKTVALSMLVIFISLGIVDIHLFFSGERFFDFFHYFYTFLIFSDILLVLIAQTFLPQFPAVFRNSGFALATLLIRLSLTAPVYFDVLIGICAIVFALVLTLIYNRFYTIKKSQ